VLSEHRRNDDDVLWRAAADPIGLKATGFSVVLPLLAWQNLLIHYI
jgi:hypothetical protein